jgi:putative transposase
VFVRRCYVYKLKPTLVQTARLQRYLDVLREVYNAALEQRIVAFRISGRALSRFTQAGEIKQLRAAGLLDGCHVHPVQDALRRLDLAYRAFFRRCKQGARRKGFPRFRSSRHWRSFTFQEWGNGVRLDEQRRRLRISGVGAVRVRLHRPLEGKPKACTVVKKPDGWYAHIACELPEATPLASTSPNNRAALDLGVEALATLHTGERIANPRHLRRAARKLWAEQRALARKRKGSRRRAKQRQRVAKAYLKLARARRDYLHKQSRMLAERYRFIAVEDLSVTAMVRSAKGTVAHPGSRIRQKAGLNRSILDAAWGELLKLLEYKLAERGGRLVPVSKAGTSQACSGCGALVPKPLSQRSHECPHCGLSIHRDHNAALNIYNRAWAASVAEAA